MADTMKRLESFPFDSRADGYDDDGYPIYDRAVGASYLRSAFKEFFTDGVFPKPADALRIDKADSGIAVTVAPGNCIIDGGIGGVPLGGDPVKITLSDSAPRGNTCYGIFLRLDDRDDYRSIYLRAAQGTTGANPTPPEPDRTTVGVYEYRLGYVTVPNGATDMTGAVVYNEKGQAVCPYAAPFEDLDISNIVEDAQEQAETAMTHLLAEYEKYKGVIDSALDGSTATYLQQQITALQESQGVDLSGEVDGETIEYTQGALDSKKYLRVKDGSIDIDKVDSSLFTDSATATSGASAKVAATPACVDNKLEEARNIYVRPTVLESKITRGYVNFSSGNFEASGFTLGSDRFTAQKKCIVIMSVFAIIDDEYGACTLYLNGSLIANAISAQSVGGNSMTSVSVVLDLDPGDYVQVNFSNASALDGNKIRSFYVQAV